MAKEAANEKEKGAAPATPGDAASAGKKKPSPLKIVIVLVAVLALQAGVIVTTIMMSKGPDKAHGHDIQADPAAEEKKLVEVEVIKERFGNTVSGVTMIFETEIFITVYKRDAEKIKKAVEAMKAQVSTDVATIFRRAEPSHFKEPTLATLERQVKAQLVERLGKDAEGEPLVHDVLIQKCIGYRADP